MESPQAANRSADNTIQAFSSRAIGIKARRPQREVLGPGVRGAAGIRELKVLEPHPLDQVNGVRRQVIHRRHRRGQVLPQVVRRHQEVAAAVVDVKAAVRADHVDNNNI